MTDLTQPPTAPTTVVCSHAKDRVGCPTAPVTVPAIDGRITDTIRLEGWTWHVSRDEWTCPWRQTGEGIG